MHYLQVTYQILQELKWKQNTFVLINSIGQSKHCVPKQRTDMVEIFELFCRNRASPWCDRLSHALLGNDLAEGDCGFSRRTIIITWLTSEIHLFWSHVYESDSCAIARDMSLRMQLFLGVFPLFSHQSPLQNFKLTDREIVFLDIKFQIRKIDDSVAQLTFGYVTFRLSFELFLNGH